MELDWCSTSTCSLCPRVCVSEDLWVLVIHHVVTELRRQVCACSVNGEMDVSSMG